VVVGRRAARQQQELLGDDGVLWFTCGVRSRKARTLRADPRCVVTTEDASDPVIIEGTARVMTDDASIGRALDLMNEKYDSGIEISFLDPARNSTIAVRPHKVIGMRHGDFTGSPTRWTFRRGSGAEGDHQDGPRGRPG
jgi:general stress protein 26